MKNSNRTSSEKSNLELTLLGIDKLWVRSKDGQWIDKNLIEKENMDSSSVTLQDDASSHWWQFWKKSPVQN